MTENSVAYRLVIDYSLIIANNQWLVTYRSLIDIIKAIDVIH